MKKLTKAQLKQLQKQGEYADEAVMHNPLLKKVMQELAKS